MEPEVLILDEPTGNLDPRTRNEFLDLLRPLREKSAIIWLTASAREAALANRIYLLRDGATTEVQGGADLLSNWRELAAAEIEMPLVYELARAMEECGWSLPSPASPSEVTEAIAAEWKRLHGSSVRRPLEEGARYPRGVHPEGTRGSYTNDR
jgi:ABC-type multidrug transport system ATPase subunit